MARVLGVLQDGTPIHVRVPIPLINYLDIVFRKYESNSGLSFSKLFMIYEDGAVEELNGDTAPVTIAGEPATYIEQKGTELAEMVDTLLNGSADPIDALARSNLLPIERLYPIAVLVEAYRCHSLYCSSSRIIILENVREMRMMLGRSIAEQGHLAVFKLEKYLSPDGVMKFAKIITHFYNHHFNYPVVMYDGFIGNVDYCCSPAVAIHVEYRYPLRITSPDHPGEDIILEEPGWYVLYHPRPQQHHVD